MKIRKSVAAITLAGAALLVATGCSESSDTVDEVTSQVSTAVETGVSKAETAASDAVDEITGLSNSDAQEILRKAVNPDTPAEQIDEVVDVTNPATKAAIIAYATASSAAGYTPEAYEVKDVSEDGDKKAIATVSVKSPHAPAPIDIKLSYVDVDGWKLSGDAVTQLAGMSRGN